MNISFYDLSVWVLPLVLAITFHEAAHAFVADRLGDNTASQLGRVSFNPIKHIDPFGTVILPAMLLFAHSPFLFGYAKPVPVNFRALRHPRRDMALVAAAGPLSNLAMALAWGLVMKLALAQGAQEGLWLGVRMMAIAGITVNLVLMALNLLPVPPLDGGRVLAGVLSPTWSAKLDRIEPYGLLIIVVLLVTGLLGPLLRPFLAAGEAVLATVLGFR